MNATYYKLLIDQIKLKPLDPSLSSNIHQTIQCLMCTNTFIATPKSKVHNFKKSNLPGCRSCTAVARYSDVNENNIKKLTQNFEILSDYGNDNYIQLKVRNKTCGHIFNSRKGNLLNRDVKCPVCNTERKRKFYQDINDERHQNSVLQKNGFVQYRQIVYKLTRDSYRTHANVINPGKLPRARSGQNGYHLDHIVSVRYCYDNDIPAEVCADYRNLRLIEWKANATKWKKPIARFPDIFNQYIETPKKVQSFIDQICAHIPLKWELYKEINEYVVTMVSQNISILYVPLNDYREQIIGTRNHFKKLKDAVKDSGYKLFIIFEDEWNNNPELVVNKLKHYFQLSSATKLHARKCSIVPITSKEKNAFLNQYHIQGTSVSKINLGAYYNDELIAVMTFCNPRILMNKRQARETDVWELARFATCSKYRVAGIASKLLAYFKHNYKWSEIYSFADRRWSEGNTYNQLGFTLKVTNPPEYFYIIEGKRRHRWGYRKDVLKKMTGFKYDPSLTEYQNMIVNNIDRIWDCGTMKFVMMNTQLIP